MAELFTSVHDLVSAISAAESPSLRPLKNRLQVRFPNVGSSHLSEAIAAALGFKTNAALQAAAHDLTAWRLRLQKIDAPALHQRLVKLGYPFRDDFSLPSDVAPPAPSEQHLQRLQQLMRLEHDRSAWAVMRDLRDACELEFARAFDLGRPQDHGDPKVAARWSAGVDHVACLPSWGTKINSEREAQINFPGSDHVVRFFQALPLSNGQLVEYESGRVSMPYVSSFQGAARRTEAAQLAGWLGWTCSTHPEWSWYMPSHTTLLLFRRHTPHQDMLRAWQGSFKRWLIEQRGQLAKRAGQTRRLALSDLIDCPHLPLDLVDFADCRERYLKEFAPALYHDKEDVMGKAVEKLMAEWQLDR